MPALLPLILEAVIKYGPTLVLSIIELCHKKDVTEEDWKALKEKYAGKTYEDAIK